MTVYTTRAPFWILVGGKWVHLDGIAPGVAVTTTRPTVVFTTLGNTVFTQQARRVNRSWTIGMAWADAEAGRWLDYSATNPGEVWFLDQMAARINMLDPRDTKGSSATTIAVEGVMMPTFITTESFTRKIRGGVAYALSYTTTRTAGAVLGTYDVGAGAVDIVAPSGTGARRGAVSFMPPADGTLTVNWTVANVTTAARLTEGSVDTVGFIEGRNTPCRVSVSDVSATFNLAYVDRPPLSDQSYVLQEVG